MIEGQEMNKRDPQEVVADKPGGHSVTAKAVVDAYAQVLAA